RRRRAGIRDRLRGASGTTGIARRRSEDRRRACAAAKAARGFACGGAGGAGRGRRLRETSPRKAQWSRVGGRRGPVRRLDRGEAARGRAADRRQETAGRSRRRWTWIPRE